MTLRYRRILIPAIALLAVLAAAVLILSRHANELLKGKIESALGPEFSIGSIELGWNAVEIRDIRYSPQGEILFSAGRISVQADLIASIGGSAVVSGIEIDQPFIRIGIDRLGSLHLPLASGKQVGADKGVLVIPPFSIDRIAAADGIILITDQRLPASRNTLRLGAVRLEGKDIAYPFREKSMELSISTKAEGALLSGILTFDGAVRLGGAVAAKGRFRGDSVTLLDSQRGPVAKAEHLGFSLTVDEKEDKLDCRIDDLVVIRPVVRIGTDNSGELDLPEPWNRLSELIRTKTPGKAR